MTLELVMPGLPPSDNNAYRNGRPGERGRHLSTRAEQWKHNVQAAWFEQVAVEQRRAFRGREYELELRFFFGLYAKSHGGMKKWDVGSHQKLTADAVAAVIGSDDMNCTRLILSKREAKNGPQTQVLLHLPDPLPARLTPRR